MLCLFCLRIFIVIMSLLFNYFLLVLYLGMNIIECYDLFAEILRYGLVGDVAGWFDWAVVVRLSIGGDEVTI